MNTTYPRVRIQGTLESLTPLHVGDGRTRESRGNRKEGEEAAQAAAVCLDAAGHPYLPGSSLRGALKRAVPAAARKLFPKNADSASRLRVFDATLPDPDRLPGDCARLPAWDGERRTFERQGVAIEPLTGTADAHKLYSLELVPTGTRFDLYMEADEISADEVRGLQQGLQALSDTGLGRGRAREQGRLSCSPPQVEYLDQERLEQWLRGEREFADCWRPLELPAVEPQPHDAGTLQVALVFDGPFLANEPGLVKEKQGEEDHAPHLEFSRHPDGRALVPAGSVKGLIRARARRILATLLADEAKIAFPDPEHEVFQQTDRLLAALFGNKGQRSLLFAGDFTGRQPAVPVERQMNGIDRFTGGVAHGKLYHVNAATDDVLEGTLRIDPARRDQVKHWMYGLLLLVARDTLEGDLALGWGKARGYGAFTAAFYLPGGQTVAAWHELLDALDKAEAQGWIGALHDQIGATWREVAAGQQDGQPASPAAMEASHE